MTRFEYLNRVIRLYIDAPDTPRKARPSDWVIARQFLEQRISLDIIEHAVALASIRRTIRTPGNDPLEPIRSLAYIRPLVEHLLRTGIDHGYREYVAARYASIK